MGGGKRALRERGREFSTPRHREIETGSSETRREFLFFSLFSLPGSQASEFLLSTGGLGQNLKAQTSRLEQSVSRGLRGFNSECTCAR